MRKEFVNCRSVWLDAAKTREELAPNRMFHRVAEYLEAMNPEKNVEKNPKLKTVKVGADVIGYPRSNAWQWTEKAADHFTKEQLDMAAAYASQQ